MLILAPNKISPCVRGPSRATVRTAANDRAVIERIDAAVMGALDAGWADVGSWQALAELGERDEPGSWTETPSIP